MLNYPKRVLTPLLFREKKFRGNCFPGAHSGAPSQKFVPIFGKIITPKSLGCPPLRHLVGTFSPKADSFRAKIRGTLAANVESSNFERAGTLRAHNSQTVPICEEGSRA